MATIKPIEGRTIHQIQSGQVIVDLCSVVKELVENSLDAGATGIDVRFKNQGLEAIEVQDNGGGISPHNYDTLALKHYTSKLTTYNDLTTLQTFGFRGEALSSLCALSNFSVITCIPESAPKGTKLEFEISGKLKGTSVVAAQKGTTVIVENLFNNLPVRRRELEKNIKREWSKVTGVLGQYACIQTGIKFTVSQQAAKGKKTTIFSTKGNPTTRENIVNVFGAKTLTQLIPMDLRLELEPTGGPSQRRSTQDDGETKDIRIIGHISRPATGEGRQTPDRQMFFVNSRPCGLPQVAKAFNEVYKSYNGWGSTQSPFIFANIELDTHLYDVNVSPDKRTILLHDQSRMLENLKTALAGLFEGQDHTIPVSQMPALKQPQYKQLTINRESASVSKSLQKRPQASPQSAEEDDAEDEVEEEEEEQASGAVSDSRRSSNAQSTASQDSHVQSNSKAKRSSMSRNSSSRDGAAINLISNRVGRKSEEQSDQRPAPPKAMQNINQGPSKEKQRLISKFGREAARVKEAEDDLASPESSIATAQDSQPASTYRPPRQIADFNDRMAEASVPRAGSKVLEGAEDPPSPSQSEPPIPQLISPSPISTPGVLSSLGSSRPQRSQPEMATITIGDHTVTSSIGIPPSKRLKVDSDSASVRESGKLQQNLPMPSFGKRLLQRFGAPGTQTSEASDDTNMIDIEEPESTLETAAPDSSCKSDADADEISPTASPVGEDAPVSSKVPPEDNADGEEEDGEYLNEKEKKVREEAKVQEMINEVERTAALPSEENISRAKLLVKGGAKRKESTFNLTQTVDTTILDISQQFENLQDALSVYANQITSTSQDEALDSDGAEERLSLTISKSDFAKMKIIGQFNLGFILASKAPEPITENGGIQTADNVFIIDQHSSDEKYNFERLQATTIVQSQRLVYPKTLSLTALEEEIVAENLDILEQNGFILTIDQSSQAVGGRCQLVSLPVSRETTFSINDLEELIALLAESGGRAGMVRPSKVRKMFAMRACRSSIMIGKSLTKGQMEKVVRHMGEIEQPWNCPHGRPTMRHLCGLGLWDGEGEGWKEDLDGERKTDWGGYVRMKRRLE
ncbi:putative dna mismatch repair protein [Botrytis fragariae]|uniref:DNA mismatch repair protein PMS1 n=1 Tax=Botrytis fragariae TaxID=1964551 RepID=A0A8H6AVD9_9HELO|nr:putative dna mismatch repair protein [Botrytis fragariae]KAF5874100.1 putative dna mismatch repair protein [Botrytis fragariae]